MPEGIIGLISITDEEFRLLAGLIYDKFGIKLTDQKKPLLVGRLNKILRRDNFQSFSEYYKFLLKDGTGKALSELIDKISTNHSYFFREMDHYNFLRDHALPELLLKKKSLGEKTLRFWSAGCAAGEEVYSLSLLLREYLGQDIGNWDMGLLATDISNTVLQQAALGIYPVEKVKEVPGMYMQKYFTRIDNGYVKVESFLKEMVTFKRLNLMNENFPFNGKFDIIFCRNVMIYFDQQTRQKLSAKFYRYLEAGGYLFIGHSESLGRDSSLFRYIKPAIYRKF